MDINIKITTLEGELSQLRVKWKQGSPAMKKMIEAQARNRTNQIEIFRRVLERQKKTAAERESLMGQMPLDGS